MRHLATLIAAMVIAPLVWVMLAFGQDRSIQAFANGEEGDVALANIDFIRPFAFLAAAGLLLGIIGTLRVSPLGATVAGLLYAGSYFALLLEPNTVVDLLPGNLSLAGRPADAVTPLRTGTILVIGVLLLVSVASFGRWRRHPAGKPEALAPDEILPKRPDDRPLGAEGLGLSSREREPAFPAAYDRVPTNPAANDPAAYDPADYDSAVPEPPGRAAAGPRYAPHYRNDPAHPPSRRPTPTAPHW